MRDSGGKEEKRQEEKKKGKNKQGDSTSQGPRLARACQAMPRSLRPFLGVPEECLPLFEELGPVPTTCHLPFPCPGSQQCSQLLCDSCHHQPCLPHGGEQPLVGWALAISCDISGPGDFCDRPQPLWVHTASSPRCRSGRTESSYGPGHPLLGTQCLKIKTLPCWYKDAAGA